MASERSPNGGESSANGWGMGVFGSEVGGDVRGQPAEPVRGGGGGAERGGGWGDVCAGEVRGGGGWVCGIIERAVRGR